METMAKYYLLDAGKNMINFAKALEDELKVNEAHVVFYLTDVEGLMCLEEISEDEFLDHYTKNTNKNGK
jgi:hypothetical protein